MTITSTPAPLETIARQSSFSREDLLACGHGEMFGDKKQLLLIHNMGQGCRYCTLWADGFNGFLKHLESVMSVVLV